jgi:hypothetical protein
MPHAETPGGNVGTLPRAAKRRGYPRGTPARIGQRLPHSLQLPATPLSPRAAVRPAEIGGFASPPRGGFALALKLEWFARLAQLSRMTDVRSRRHRTKLETAWGVEDGVFVLRRRGAPGRDPRAPGPIAAPGIDRGGFRVAQGRAPISSAERGGSGLRTPSLTARRGLRTFAGLPPPGSRGRRERRGAIAQLGERLHGMQEVGGSIPPGSTIPTPPIAPPISPWAERSAARAAIAPSRRFPSAPRDRARAAAR